MVSSAWKFDWLTSWDEIWSPEFVAQWQSWFDATPDANLFFHPSIARAWCDTYRVLRSIEPQFLIAERRTGNVVFFPLILDRGRWKDGWLRVLTPVGFNEFDYHDPIRAGEGLHFEANALSVLLSDATRNARITADWLRIPRIQQTRSSDHVTDISIVGTAPYIALDRYRGFDEYVGTLHRQLRQELRRQPRRLQQLAPLRLRVYGSNEVLEATQTLPALLHAHRSRWPHAYRAPALHENLIKHGLPPGLVHVSTLQSGTRAISWHIGFVHGTRTYYYLPAYDQSMGSYSPGKVHLAMLIEDAFTRGGRVFDLLTGDEDYKLRWANGAVNLLRLDRRVSGAVGLSRAGLRFGLRQAGRLMKSLRS